MATPVPAQAFSGSVAVISGGASGIGLATAEAFVAAGAHVVLLDRDGDRLRTAAAQLRATSIVGDVSRPDDCSATATAAAAVGQPVRWLVNCGASFLAKGEQATAADWDLSLGVNVKGTALLAAAVVPLQRAAGGGAIVNVASISGYIAQPNRWTYNATKGAILALTRCQALDLAPDHIRVNSISPGTIWTPELDRMANGDRAGWEPIFAPHHMLNRVGEPSEVAAAILFLCSPAASFVTGADLVCDGGYIHMGHDRMGSSITYSDR